MGCAFTASVLEQLLPLYARITNMRLYVTLFFEQLEGLRLRVINRLRSVKWLNGAALTEDEIAAALRIAATSRITHVSS